MTPEQIIEELETLASYYGNDFNGNETKEHKALTAALEYIKDMREVEAAAEGVDLADGFLSGWPNKWKWYPDDEAKAISKTFDTLREAFKSVKGGSE